MARLVEILCFHDVQLLDVAGPLQVMATANDLLAAQGRAPAYEVRVVASATPVATSSGLALASDGLARASMAPDTLIVAGGRGVHVAAGDKSLLLWLSDRAAVARRVASICSGAFLLAAAGLLDGHRAATHWRDAPALAERFPAVRVDGNAIYVRDGKLWTSAGVTAGIDLTLAFLQEDEGHAVAAAVARELVVFLRRPGGQAQFSAALALQSAGARFESLHAWIAQHLDTQISLATLAAQAGMSERNFLRRYRAATGTTPARAVERLRAEAAGRLLMETRLPLKRIARACGFGSEETLRRAFHRQFAIAPRDYRARFSPAPIPRGT